jgi:hypothetical protein
MACSLVCCAIVVSVLSRFVLVEWIGGDTEMGRVMDLSDFSPVLNSFLSKHITISLSSQASHPSQVTQQAIWDDLDASQRHGSGGRSRSSSGDSEGSDGSFVDLNAQFAAEKAAVGGDSSSPAIAPSGGSAIEQLAALMSADVDDDSDFLSPEQVEAEIRARTQRKLSTAASTPVVNKTAATSTMPPGKPSVPVNPSPAVAPLVFSQTMPHPGKSVLKTSPSPHASVSDAAGAIKKSVSFSNFFNRTE